MKNIFDKCLCTNFYCLGVFLSLISCHSKDTSKSAVIDSIPTEVLSQEVAYELICEQEDNRTYCRYANYRTVLTIDEDYKGRAESSSNLEKKTVEGYQSIKPSELLVGDSQWLVDRMNKEVAAIYQELKTAFPEGDECLEEIFLKDSYEVNDFSISFYEKGIFFGVDFGLSSACLAIDGNGFLLEWEAIKPLIRR